MALAVYKAPYTLRQILNADPSIMATPEPKAEELAYQVAADQAATSAEARQREENIGLKELALSNQAYKAQNRVNFAQGELDLAKSQAPVSLAFATAGAGVKGLGALMQAKKMGEITARMEAYQGKMADTYTKIMDYLGARGTSMEAQKGEEAAAQEKAVPSALRRWGH